MLWCRSEISTRAAFPSPSLLATIAVPAYQQKTQAEQDNKHVAQKRHCSHDSFTTAGVYYEQGKLNEAIQSYQEAIAREPNFPEAYNNLGNALREASRPDEAIACYTMCIQLQFARPQNAQMARALQANPQMAAMQQAQRLGVAYNNLGGILKMQGRAAEAIACYEHVALLQPDSPEAHANLASAYKDAARQDTAIASYRRALQLRPDFPEAFANMVHSLQCICEWQDRQPLFVRLEAEVRRELAADRLPPVQPFHAMAYPFSAELALKISAKYAEYCAVAAARMAVPKLPHPPPHRLQVGNLNSRISVWWADDLSVRKCGTPCYVLGPMVWLCIGDTSSLPAV